MVKLVLKKWRRYLNLYLVGGALLLAAVVSLVVWPVLSRPNELKPSDVANFKQLDRFLQRNWLKGRAEANPDWAWKLLKSAYIQNGQTTDNVHDLAHIVGNAAYRSKGVNGVAVCDQSFAYGCFHGVTERAILEQGKSAATTIFRSCQQVFPGVGSKQSNCVHGIGHGLVASEQYELYPALKDCENSIPFESQTYCYDGVFMEFTGGAPPDKFTLSKAKPWEWCGQLKEPGLKACGKYGPILMKNRLGMTNAETGGLCAKTRLTVISESCFRSIGYYLTQASQGNPSGILGQCRDMPNLSGINLCLTGAAVEMTFQHYSGWEKASALLCNKVSNSSQTKTCLSEVDQVDAVYRQDQTK